MDKAKGAPGPDAFKRAPRRKKEPVKKVVLSPEARRQYEELAQKRDELQRSYEGHLPGDKTK
jgi:hypothetical protein